MMGHIGVTREFEGSFPTITLTIGDEGDRTTSFTMDVSNAEQLAQLILALAAEHRADNPQLFTVSRSTN